MLRVLILLIPAITGCSNLFNQHAQLMDAMRGVMADTAARLGQSGTGQIAAGGQVINPGIRVSGGMEYYAVAQYQGVSGQVQASMMGSLDRDIPPDVQSRADAIWRETSLNTATKMKLIEKLLAQLRDKSPEASAPTMSP